MQLNDQIAPVGDTAVREIVAGVAAECELLIFRVEIAEVGGQGQRLGDAPGNARH